MAMVAVAPDCPRAKGTAKKAITNKKLTILFIDCVSQGIMKIVDIAVQVDIGALKFMRESRGHFGPCKAPEDWRTPRRFAYFRQPRPVKYQWPRHQHLCTAYFTGRTSRAASWIAAALRRFFPGRISNCANVNWNCHRFYNVEHASRRFFLKTLKGKAQTCHALPSTPVIDFQINGRLW